MRGVRDGREGVLEVQRGGVLWGGSPAAGLVESQVSVSIVLSIAQFSGSQSSRQEQGPQVGEENVALLWEQCLGGPNYFPIKFDVDLPAGGTWEQQLVLWLGLLLGRDIGGRLSERRRFVSAESETRRKGTLDSVALRFLECLSALVRKRKLRSDCAN